MQIDFFKLTRSELADALKELKYEVILFEDDERFLFADYVRNNIMIRSFFSAEEIQSQNQQMYVVEAMTIINSTFDTCIWFSKAAINLYIKDYCKKF